MYRVFKKRNEKHLETARIQAYERASELRILKELAEILNQTLPPEKALEAGLEQVARQVGASAGWLLTLTPDHRAELSAGYQLPSNMELAAAGNRTWALCACLKEAMNNQLATPRRFECERLARTPGIAADQKQHFSIPVRASGVTVGILNLVFPPERSFDEVEMRLISSLGDQFGGAVERARLFRDVHRLAITDALTGLYNRRHLLAMIVAEMERARRYNHSISLAILDIDHFKQINDTFGHLAGDQVLVEVARVCQDIIRRVDLIGRFGGEEILILMPETTPDQAVVAMERLREQIERLDFNTKRGNAHLTISIGMTSLSNDESIDFDHFLDRADQALYLAKNQGRNQVRVI
ncbi:MAG TPA: sensor domain-containing diguanylate cyclase [Anaerolineaceae bacterium]